VAVELGDEEIGMKEVMKIKVGIMVNTARSDRDEVTATNN